ncbi:uncharacterized protein LOC107480828 [Arachis duranensis]|uniref:Uncharacterized protein LOC107480828 n=1 Tax=Arachis duranensis TaxID=130453 RepID=A0A6P4CUC2_ARADU|nr:uncharacterized protein LOC107480828 [Arachis duranensis]
MNKSILLVVVLSLVIGVTMAELESEKQYGPCGKFSTQRILTHKLSHCEKPARNLYAPVSRQCCQDLQNVSFQCLVTVFSSDAFTKIGVDPHVAMTIPSRCHHAYHDNP